MTPAELTHKIRATPFTGRRRLVAIAGPPASGKSTLAEGLSEANADFCTVPMDGFHLDNALLIQADTLPRKGAPFTFDAAGFVHLMRRLKTEDEVIFPRFDRSRDASINAAGRCDGDIETVIVEGNYLLLDQPVWSDLSDLWDLSVQLRVPLPVLQDRLTQRWRDHGFTLEAALAKAQSNDLINAAFVLDHSRPADISIDAV